MAAFVLNFSWQLRKFAARGAFVGLALLAVVTGEGVRAEEAGKPGLSIELNGLAQSGEACQLTFVSNNALGVDLHGVSLEIVVFDTKSIVRHLTIFDFGALPDGRARVRRFELAKTSCDDIGRILVNGVTGCEGAPEDACGKGLELTNRTSVEFGG